MMSSGQLRVKAGHSKSASVRPAIPGEWKFGEGFDTLDLKEAKASGRAILAKKSVAAVEDLDPDTEFPAAQPELWIRGFEATSE